MFRKLDARIQKTNILGRPKTSNLDYMIDPTFRNIDSLLVLSFKARGNDHMRDYFDKY